MPGAIVLVGGAGTRLGGRAKPLLRLGGRTLLERSLAALAGCAPIVAVGPVLDPAAGIDWVREDPPRSGPVAAIAAGLAALGPGVPEVLVLAGDLAHPDAVVGRLAGPVRGDAVLLRADGHPQWLAGRYRTAALRDALGRFGGPIAGASCRAVLGGLAVQWCDDHDGISADIDTAADLDRVRAAIEGD